MWPRNEYHKRLSGLEDYIKRFPRLRDTDGLPVSVGLCECMLHEIKTLRRRVQELEMELEDRDVAG